MDKEKYDGISRQEALDMLVSDKEIYYKIDESYFLIDRDNSIGVFMDYKLYKLAPKDPMDKWMKATHAKDRVDPTRQAISITPGGWIKAFGSQYNEENIHLLDEHHIPLDHLFNEIKD